jgi:hypothetical protein
MQNILVGYKSSLRRWAAFCLILMVSVMMIPVEGVVAQQTNSVAASRGVNQGLINAAKRWWGNLWSSTRKMKKYVTVTKGRVQSLAMPLLTNTPQKLVTGKTKLYLGWIGGKAPYTVEVRKRLVTPISKTLTKEEIKEDENNFIEIPINLVEGIYTVEVLDANKKSVQARFEVVSSLPSDIESRISQEFSPALLPWQLEIYQHLVEETSEEALRTKVALEMGRPSIDKR